jgi:hypothetical protein
MRSEPKRFSRTAPPNKRSGSDWTRLTLKEYLCQVAPAEVRERFARQATYVAANQGRLVHYLASSAAFREILGAAAKTVPTAPKALPEISKNFIHTTRGVRGGRLQYALKQGLTQVEILGETAAGEVHTVKVSDLGTQTNTISIKGNRDKLFRLRVDNKLGAGRDYLHMIVDQVPLTAGGELQINIKPGIGGIELVSAGQQIKAAVTLSYVRRGLELTSTFQVDAKDGVRVVPSTVITANQLKVSRIDALFGDSLESKLITPTV